MSAVDCDEVDADQHQAIHDVLVESGICDDSKMKINDEEQEGGDDYSERPGAYHVAGLEDRSSDGALSQISGTRIESVRSQTSLSSHVTTSSPLYTDEETSSSSQAMFPDEHIPSSLQPMCLPPVFTNSAENAMNGNKQKVIQHHIEDVHLKAVLVDTDEIENRVRRSIVENAVQADVLPDDSHKTTKQNRRYLVLLAILLLVLVATFSIVAGFSLRLKNENEPIFQSPTNERTSAPTSTPVSTLASILDRGTILCGIVDTGGITAFDGLQATSFEVCEAIAATIAPDKIQIERVIISISERFIALANHTIDIVATGSHLTLERDVYEHQAGVGLSFSDPFVYDGLHFAGLPLFVECAENGITGGACADLKVCVQITTTHKDFLSTRLAAAQLVDTESIVSSHYEFLKGTCNVIADLQYLVSEAASRFFGNQGEYIVGKISFTNVPLSTVVRDDDAQWSTIVNGVIQILVAAEERNFTLMSAKAYDAESDSNAHRTRFPGNFFKAIAAVGNFGEIYERNLESLFPRSGLNFLNKKSNSGLIYSHPFGENGQNSGPEPLQGGMLDRILDRGKLRCGISRRKGFGEFDTETKQWSGMDADFCRAVGSSAFGGIADSTIFVELPSNEEGRFATLAKGDVDVLSGGTFFIDNDILEPTFKGGYAFSQPYYYNDLYFGGNSSLVEKCGDNLRKSSIACQGLKICVVNGTVHHTHLRTLLPDELIVPTTQFSVQELYDADCNAIAGSEADVSNLVGREGSIVTVDTREIKMFSKYSLSLVTRHDDPQWSAFVKWIVTSTFYAEEGNINRSNPNLMPLIENFGKTYKRMFRDVIAAVGNYGEIYVRNVEALIPRGSRNRLNINPHGGQIFSSLDL